MLFTVRDDSRMKARAVEKQVELEEELQSDSRWATVKVGRLRLVFSNENRSSKQQKLPFGF
jgi:hypothetical protein